MLSVIELSLVLSDPIPYGPLHDERYCKLLGTGPDREILLRTLSQNFYYPWLHIVTRLCLGL